MRNGGSSEQEWKISAEAFRQSFERDREWSQRKTEVSERLEEKYGEKLTKYLFAYQTRFAKRKYDLPDRTNIGGDSLTIDQVRERLGAILADSLDPLSKDQKNEWIRDFLLDFDEVQNLYLSRTFSI